MSREIDQKKALIEYRMKRAHESLRDATMLYKQNGSPAGVVNRAYYSMFYAALALLVTMGKETSKHRGVIAFFDEYFVKPGIFPKEMSKFLHNAFDMRQTGDYENEAELSQEQALQILESATHFVNSIEEKLSNQP
jgi:uncharacterized protein (UPF0332 family)